MEGRAHVPHVADGIARLRAKGRTSGLHVRATDQEWSCGDGAEVQGPSEALALAILGRAAAYNDLSGDGVALLRSRLD